MEVQDCKEVVEAWLDITVVFAPSACSKSLVGGSTHGCVMVAVLRLRSELFEVKNISRSSSKGNLVRSTSLGFLTYRTGRSPKL
jgi:hypothetical protein